MARPRKTGLEYFNLDCKMDSEMEYIQALHGLNGFAVVVRLWQIIYKQHGYYTEWNKKIKLLFSKDNQIKISEVEKILDTCFEEGVFDKEIYEKEQILTSSGVQRRYVKICKESKRKGVKLEETYVCAGLIQELKGLIPELTIVKSELSTQSKVKESKVKERKELFDDAEKLKFSELTNFLEFKNKFSNDENWKNGIFLEFEKTKFEGEKITPEKLSRILNLFGLAQLTSRHHGWSEETDFVKHFKSWLRIKTNYENRNSNPHPQSINGKKNAKISKKSARDRIREKYNFDGKVNEI